MFNSKNKKFKKLHKINYKNFKVYDKLYYGSLGLKILESCYLKIEHLEAAIKVIKRIIKKRNILKVQVFPDFPVTQKPNDIRMGKGKGNVAFKVCRLYAGDIVYELVYNNYYLMKKALEISALRLPVKTKIVNILKW